jgi:hypothetical protein
MTAIVTEEMQQQVLSAVRKSQEITLDAVRRVVDAVSTVQAKLPAAPRGLKLPERPALPLADKLPKLPEPEAVVTSAFDFVGELLAQQRKFAADLFAATSALRPAKAGAGAGDEEDAADAA